MFTYQRNWNPLIPLFKIPIHCFLCLWHPSPRVLQLPTILGKVYMFVWFTSYGKCFTSHVKLYRTSFSQNKLALLPSFLLILKLFNDFHIILPSLLDLLSRRIYHWSLIPQYLSSMLFSRCLNNYSWLTSQNYVFVKK